MTGEVTVCPVGKDKFVVKLMPPLMAVLKSLWLVKNCGAADVFARQTDRNRPRAIPQICLLMTLKA